MLCQLIAVVVASLRLTGVCAGPSRVHQLVAVGRRCTEPRGSQSFGESVWFCTGSWLPLAGYGQFLWVLHPAGFGDSPPSSCLGVFTLGACSVVNSGGCFWHLGNFCYALHSYLFSLFWALPDWAITQWIDACFHRWVLLYCCILCKPTKLPLWEEEKLSSIINGISSVQNCLIIWEVSCYLVYCSMKTIFENFVSILFSESEVAKYSC